MLLTSEEVCSIECFFKRKLSELPPQSQESVEAWWDAIKDVFWKVFRGVIRGLMHLFVSGKSCGHLVFSAFVTSEGEGRILPSMETAKQKQDLIALVDLMKSVIKLPIPHQSDLSFLPHDLKHFFQLSILNLSIPLEFFIDHPYFWNVAEKIDFTFRLRKFVKQTSTSGPFRKMLNKYNYHRTWWVGLVGVYWLVYDQASKRKTTKSYKTNIDIVRYFGAVYTHVNEYEYKVARNRKRFTYEKIEADLAKIFPDFYISMFYSLCMCEEALNYADFTNLSTILSYGGCYQ